MYDGLVADGVIVPKPEEAPPTVPMDFNWARVSLSVVKVRGKAYAMITYVQKKIISDQVIK